MLENLIAERGEIHHGNLLAVPPNVGGETAKEELRRRRTSGERHSREEPLKRSSLGLRGKDVLSTERCSDSTGTWAERGESRRMLTQ